LTAQDIAGKYPEAAAWGVFWSRRGPDLRELFSVRDYSKTCTVNP
jgi:hypothetical protein